MLGWVLGFCCHAGVGATANKEPRPDAVSNPWFTGPQPPPDVIPIDVGRQLFVDDYLVEQTTLQRVFHQSVYHPASPVLRPDKPWEGTSANPFSDGVWYDPRERLYKMWYYANRKNTCYATSLDGIHWEKPILDVSPGTNIVYEGRRDSSTIILDLHEKDPAKRYKFFRSHGRPNPLGMRKGIWGLSLHYSADGIHWTETITRSGFAGDRSTAFYNPFRGAWIYSVRGPNGPETRKRFYWEAKDLQADPTWDLERNPPLLWAVADKLDPAYPGTNIASELYNLDATPYESLMIGFFTILRGDVDNKTPVTPGRPKPNNVCLGFSRDGYNWVRPDRRPFMDYSEIKGAWNWGNVQSTGGGCLVVGDELYFYTSGRAGSPEARDSGASTGLAILRRDGFASMEAAGEAGTLTTRPVRFSGKRLFVNFSAKEGDLRVEVLDEKGNSIPIFSRESCRAMRGDSTLQEVTWNGVEDLAALRNRPVRFRFHLRRGSLYAFWVSPDETGASQGYVAAGGPGFTGPKDTRGINALNEARGQQFDRAGPQSR